jgi:hypothetical protein
MQSEDTYFAGRNNAEKLGSMASFFWGIWMLDAEVVCCRKESDKTVLSRMGIDAQMDTMTDCWRTSRRNFFRETKRRDIRNLYLFHLAMDVPLLAFIGRRVYKLYVKAILRSFVW